jgi:uridylate kinase
MVEIVPQTPESAGGRWSDIAGPDVQRKRILLKLSGEAFAGDQGIGLDTEVIGRLAAEIIEVRARGVEIAVVVGGGNIVRGTSCVGSGIEEAQGHYMGMLGTVINALALQAIIERQGAPCRVQSALQMQAVAEPFIRRRATRHLEKGRVVVFAAGTGNPYFTTDTAAALRATEIGAEVLIMAKNRVDGVYDRDPNIHPDACKYHALTYEEAFRDKLKVMDLTALTHSMQHDMPIVVCDIGVHGNVSSIVSGEDIGTLVSAKDAVTALLERIRH